MEALEKTVGLDSKRTDAEKITTNFDIWSESNQFLVLKFGLQTNHRVLKIIKQENGNV